mmetsp:Transcript_38743/g.121445  ORF Transcript_38743/g.121445 Transcript_38743/m.121445 type:complete len:233 (-) Transcript_38743:786-1484(-)
MMFTRASRSSALPRLRIHGRCTPDTTFVVLSWLSSLPMLSSRRIMSCRSAGPGPRPGGITCPLASVTQFERIGSTLCAASSCVMLLGSRVSSCTSGVRTLSSGSCAVSALSSASTGTTDPLKTSPPTTPQTLLMALQATPRTSASWSCNSATKEFTSVDTASSSPTVSMTLGNTLASDNRTRQLLSSQMLWKVDTASSWDVVGSFLMSSAMASAASSRTLSYTSPQSLFQSS